MTSLLTLIRLDKALSVSSGFGDVCGMSGGDFNHVLMNNQAEVHKLKPEYVEAHTIHTHILQEASVERDPYYHALALLNVAEIDMSMGAQEQHVEKNIQTAQKLFNTRRLGMEMMMCETILADLYLRGGNPLVAESLFEKCSWWTLK
jgi:ATP/maltotriose-dependent transcriptional regulator MalT